MKTRHEETHELLRVMLAAVNTTSQSKRYVCMCNNTCMFMQGILIRVSILQIKTHTGGYSYMYTYLLESTELRVLSAERVFECTRIERASHASTAAITTTPHLLHELTVG